jgi:hypothetical protein
MSLLKITSIISLLPAILMTTPTPVLAQDAPAATAASQVQPLRKWEYLRVTEQYEKNKYVIIIEGRRYDWAQLNEALNYLGNQGWELVNESGDSGTLRTWVFKREIQQN